MGQTKVQRVLKQLSGGSVQKQTPIANDMFLPNHSGIASHPEAINDLLDTAKMDGRPLISREAKTITVGTDKDYQTIQEAIDQVPIFLKHQYKINIDAGTYSEDVIINPTFTYGNTRGDITEGATGALWLTGDTTTPTNVKVKSFMIISSLGAAEPILDGFSITGTEPTSDEEPAVSVYGGGHIIFANSTFEENTTAKQGIMFYGSSGSVTETEIGTDKLENAFLTKHGGRIVHRDGTISGTCTKYVFRSIGGGLITFKGDDVTATGTLGLTNADNGLIIDTDNKRMYNIEEIPSDFYFVDDGTGLPFGQIYEEDGTSTLALAAQDTYYQITAFSANGESNLTTPDHTNDHITVSKAGKYLVSASIAIESAQANEYDFHVQKNNGATDFQCISIHLDTNVASKTTQASATGILDLDANDTVELWVKRLDGGAVSKTITIINASITLTQIGG